MITILKNAYCFKKYVKILYSFLSVAKFDKLIGELWTGYAETIAMFHTNFREYCFDPESLFYFRKEERQFNISRSGMVWHYWSR